MLRLLKPERFTAWNLAALIDTDLDRAEDLIERLVDAELVEGGGADTTGLIRYRFHDLMRDFAMERLADSESLPDQRDAVLRFAEQYIGMARLGSALLQPGSLQKEAGAVPLLAEDVVRRDPRGWFAAERTSLVSAVHLAYEAGLWDQDLAAGGAASGDV
jgi:hypothetical protein